MSSGDQFHSNVFNRTQHNRTSRLRTLIAFHFVIAFGSLNLQAEDLPEFDFIRPGETAHWQATHDVGELKETPDGMLITITGNDPFIEAPVTSFANSNPIHLRIRLKSTAGGFAQLFWFDDHATEEQSIWFATRTNEWTDLCLPLPPLTEVSRLRFDPPGTNGTCTIDWMVFEDTNARGIRHVAANPTEIVLTVAGLRGEVHFVELQPNQCFSDALTGQVVDAARQQGDTPVTIPRFEITGKVSRDRLYSKFVPMQTRSGRKMPIGPERFVEEFKQVSQFNTKFPIATSKKGLQVQMPDDALKLKIQHAALNVSLTGLVDFSRNPANLTWQMDGETYYFNRQYVESLPVKSLSETGCVVSLILLATKSGNERTDSVMLHPDRATTIPNGITAFNTTTNDGLRHYKACIEFLANRFSRPDAAFGLVANYIVGNEVNSHWEWYNMGLCPGEVVVADYERSVRIAQTAVRKSSASARVYLSLEHHWTMPYVKDPRKSLPGRKLIEEFNRRAQLGGNFDWNLAFHPYPENLFKPRTWLDKTAIDSPDSPRITFKNLEQLTAFFRRPELLFHNQPRRIILSEQGFHSDGTEEGDLAQAAAYCYAWQKVSRLDGIDSFILHRHVDHAHEGGLNLGLWRRRPNSIADPSTPRPMYEVFQKADTPEREAAFQFALPIIGIKNWDEIFVTP